jgi:hypothetical protein
MEKNRLWKSSLKLDPLFKGMVKAEPGGNWRSDPRFFRCAASCRPLPGSINLSPAWFQQARDVSVYFIQNYLYRFGSLQLPTDMLEVSAPLKPGKAKPAATRWLSETAESFALMGALLHVVHPELYEAGRQIFRKLLEDPSQIKEGSAAKDVLKFWTSPFSGYNLISNRETPFHRDNFSRVAWYDLLTTLGPESHTRLLLPNIGIEMDYGPGTIVALGGTVLRHGVPMSEGNRLCIAQYMRDNVFNKLGIMAPGWMTVSVYEKQ